MGDASIFVLLRKAKCGTWLYESLSKTFIAHQVRREHTPHCVCDLTPKQWKQQSHPVLKTTCLLTSHPSGRFTAGHRVFADDREKCYESKNTKSLMFIKCCFCWTVIKRPEQTRLQVIHPDTIIVADLFTVLKSKWMCVSEGAWVTHVLRGECIKAI